MAKSYTELEAWGIFVGALIIGVVLTSLFWAFITVPENLKEIKKEIANASGSAADSVRAEPPSDFITFCKTIDGEASWDSTGFRNCVVDDPSEKNLRMMGLLCKKFNLTLSYGSYGVKCEGRQ